MGVGGGGWGWGAGAAIRNNIRAQPGGLLSKLRVYLSPEKPFGLAAKPVP